MPTTLPTVLRSNHLKNIVGFVKKSLNIAQSMRFDLKILEKSRSRLPKQQYNPWKFSCIGGWPEIAPGRKGRGVCTFHVLIHIHYIVVNLIVKYLLSMFST